MLVAELSAGCEWEGKAKLSVAHFPSLLTSCASVECCRCPNPSPRKAGFAVVSPVMHGNAGTRFVGRARDFLVLLSFLLDPLGYPLSRKRVGQAFASSLR